MPALCSNWPSSSPDGPAPMMATWVREFVIVVSLTALPVLSGSDAGWHSLHERDQLIEAAFPDFALSCHPVLGEFERAWREPIGTYSARLASLVSTRRLPGPPIIGPHKPGSKHHE